MVVDCPEGEPSRFTVKSAPVTVPGAAAAEEDHKAWVPWTARRPRSTAAITRPAALMLPGNCILFLHVLPAGALLLVAAC
jgi:hypothetical protein